MTKESDLLGVENVTGEFVNPFTGNDQNMKEEVKES